MGDCRNTLPQKTFRLPKRYPKAIEFSKEFATECQDGDRHSLMQRLSLNMAGDQLRAAKVGNRAAVLRAKDKPSR
jgi:hypothetical protein